MLNFLNKKKMRKVLNYAKFFLALFSNISVIFVFALTGILPVMMLMPIGVILLCITLQDL